MGQKTSPISTRLYGNCWPESCWYSDANTFSLFYQEFNQKQFFDSIMPPTGRKFGFRPASVVCHQFPKKNYIHLFFLRRNRRLKLRGNKRRRIFRFAKHLNKKTSRFQSKGLRMPVNKRLSMIDVVAIYHLYMNKNMLLAKLLPFANYAKQLRKKMLSSKSCVNPLKKSTPLAVTMLGLRSNKSSYNNLGIQNKDRKFEEKKQLSDKKSFSQKSVAKQKKNSLFIAQPLHSSLPQQKIDFGGTPFSPLESCSFASKRPYNTHMTELFRFTSGSNAFIVPLRLNSMMVSASLIATHICSLLQQKKRFKSICKWLFKDIKKYEAIKGVRISCSGRLNGKAIARTDLRKLGETSLHTFKKKIDYAQSMAITRHGVLGIKVWVSYSVKGDDTLDNKNKKRSKWGVEPLQSPAGSEAGGNSRTSSCSFPVGRRRSNKRAIGSQ